MTQKPTKTEIIPDLFADLEDGDDDLAAQLRTELATKARRDLPEEVRKRLRSLEDEILFTSGQAVLDTLAFRDIDPGTMEAPAEWNMDPAEAAKRLRLARAAWENKRTAPVGLAIAPQVFMGISKARAVEKQATGPKTLNVVVAQMTVPLPQYEEIVLQTKEDE